MIRKSMLTLSIVGLVLSVGLWGASYYTVMLIVSASGPVCALSEGCVQVNWAGLPAQQPLPSNYATLPAGTVMLTDLVLTGNSHTLSGRATTIKGPVATDLFHDGAAWRASTLTYRTGLAWKGFSGWSTRWKPQLILGTPTRRQIQLPLWIPTMLCLLGVLFRGRLALRRHVLGLCVCCGYDLRGSSDKCPECGHPLETAT